MKFRIKNKEIFYCDDFFKKELRLIPKDAEFIRKVMMSRNRLPRQLMNMFNLSEKDQKEYDEANTEEQLAEIIKKDCKTKGLKFVKEEEENNGVEKLCH